MDRHDKLISFLIIVSAFTFSQPTFADDDVETIYSRGYALYDQDKYEEALPDLEKAIELAPENAKYHHALAKSYGRAAEKSNWFKAMSLAKKTLRHLQIAVDLDKHNTQYLDDLMDFYREAPGFLGGDKKKANEIEVLIEKLSQTEKQPPDCEDCLKIE